MFVLNEKSGAWELKLGEECAALYDDGYYYLAVLNEIGPTFAQVTFNLDQKHAGKKRNLSLPDGAPVPGETASVAMNDICNVSWAMRNLYTEFMDIDKGVACKVREQLPSGKLLVEKTGKKLFKSEEVTYDMLRFTCVNDPFFPSAAEVAAMVTGRVSVDAKILRARLVANLNRAFGIAQDGDYTLFDRKIHVSSASSKLLFLERLYRKHMRSLRAYTKMIGTKTITSLKTLQSLYDLSLELFTPIHQDLFDALTGAGLAITPAKYARLNHSDVPYANLDKLIAEYNKLVDKKNEYIREHNSEPTEGLATAIFSAAANRVHPDSVLKGKDLPGLMLEDLNKVLYNLVYKVFTKAVNDYVGEPYFDRTEYVEQPSTKELWDEYIPLPAEERNGPRGLDYMLRILAIHPFDQKAYRNLLATFVRPGCGLEDFVKAANPGQNALGKIKWTLTKEYFEAGALYPKTEADSTLKYFYAFVANGGYTREDAAPGFDLATLVQSAYTLYDSAYDLMLNRYVYAQRPNAPHHPSLIKAVREVESTLRGSACVPACQPYAEALLSVCAPLLELIEEDSRTFEGKKLASYEERFDVFKEAFDVIAAQEHFDFAVSADVSELLGLIDANPRRELLMPLREKLERSVALAGEIRAFLDEVSGREYVGRTQLIYDLMNSDILSSKALVLWMKHSGLKQWRSKYVDIALGVFDRDFDSIDDANEYYYDVMERAWLYQEYLDVKGDKQAGFFKKVGNAMAGEKKRCEPEYLLATDNGARPLMPLAEDERALVASYWQYKRDESDRIYEEHCRRYDPAALEGHKRMTEIKATINAIVNKEALDRIRSEVLNGEWEMTNPTGDRTDAIALSEMTWELPDKASILLREKRAYKPGEQVSFLVSGITQQMQNDQGLIGLYNVNAAHNDCILFGDLRYVQPLYNIAMPENPGRYELRMYQDRRLVDESLLASVTVAVEP